MKMKTNYLLLSMCSLLFFWGCSNLDGELTGTNVPESEVRAGTPIEEGCNGCYGGSILLAQPGIRIEYFDKECELGFRLRSGQEYVDYIDERITVEVISYMDEITGNSLTKILDEYRGVNSISRDILQFGSEFFERDSPEVIRDYVLKYKVPSFKGESIEEIRGIYHHEGGLNGSFTEVWYNGKIIPIIDYEEIEKYYSPGPGIVNTVRYESIIKETHYSGEPVAIQNGYCLYLVLPYEKS